MRAGCYFGRNSQQQPARRFGCGDGSWLQIRTLQPGTASFRLCRIVFLLSNGDVEYRLELGLIGWPQLAIADRGIEKSLKVGSGFIQAPGLRHDHRCSDAM